MGEGAGALAARGDRAEMGRTLHGIFWLENPICTNNGALLP
jgi:hypothetical protein